MSSLIEARIREDGSLELPEALISSLGLRPGENITLYEDEEGVTFLPKRFVFAEIVAENERIMKEQGITLKDLLDGLEEVREQLFKERYGDLLE